MSSDNEKALSDTLTPTMSDYDEEAPSGELSPTMSDYDDEMPSGELTPTGSYADLKSKFDRGELYIGHNMYYRTRWEEILNYILDELYKHMKEKRCVCYENVDAINDVIDAVIGSSRCTAIKGEKPFNYTFKSKKCRIDEGCLVSAKIELNKNDAIIEVYVSEPTDAGEDPGSDNKDKDEERDLDGCWAKYWAKDWVKDWAKNCAKDDGDVFFVSRLPLDTLKKNHKRRLPAL